MADTMNTREAADKYLKDLEFSAAAKTILRRRTTLNHLIAEGRGEIQPRNLGRKHLTKTYKRMAKTHNKASLNVDRSILAGFFEWCREEKLTSATHDPSRRKRWKESRPNRFMLDIDEFDDLLEAAETPRDRILLALGFYLFLRASEIQNIKIRDVDLDDGMIKIKIDKTDEEDVMPICEELDAELRTWLTHYTERVGVLKRNYYLVPSRHMRGTDYCPIAGHIVAVDEKIETLRPTGRVVKPELVVGAALRKLGYPAIDEDTGATNRQGVHILRRSGARALFDDLRSEGYDGALQRVRVMLHHESVRTTELYLNINVEKVQRDERFRGKPLFPGAKKKKHNAEVAYLADRRSG